MSSYQWHQRENFNTRAGCRWLKAGVRFTLHESHAGDGLRGLVPIHTQLLVALIGSCWPSSNGQHKHFGKKYTRMDHIYRKKMKAHGNRALLFFSFRLRYGITNHLGGRHNSSLVTIANLRKPAHTLSLIHI